MDNPHVGSRDRAEDDDVRVSTGVTVSDEALALVARQIDKKYFGDLDGDDSGDGDDTVIYDPFDDCGVSSP